MPVLPRRAARLAVGGAIVCLATLVFVEPVLDQLLMPKPPAHSPFYRYATGDNRPHGLAPVLLWGEGPPGETYRRASRTLRILVVKGEAFVVRQHIPRADLPDYLNARVSRNEIEQVLVTPAVSSQWGEILPTIDACRRSDVRLVLLNFFEW